ncbi:predicted protein [Nematostella vectensis]|uniref:Uncharacterized protein n=1 Tax=Nematostella vectensis TaxID=45351 RepID=A7T811_NEMVE|nr:predicted protein [Nematostella vectensis]|eukprot:XP_001619983.1 hypothetical protein NEMVEDRAFT_v1g223602 [Nematostella vectensis]
MVVRVIIVLTNHKDGGPGWKTGWYLPEAAHPYHVFKQNGYQVTFASPLGGDAPMVSIVDTKLSNGEYLVKGKEVTCFTNDEEDAMDKSKLMPFMLETRLIEHGAKFKRAKNWECMVCVDNRVVTGQNPASASPMGEAIVKLQKAKE